MPAPRDIFTAWQESVLAGRDIAPLLDADVVIELPFNPPGKPRLIEGRDRFLASTEDSRRALPVRFDAFHDTVIHETADPEVVIAEYVIEGTHLPTGKRSRGSFVMVLRVRDGAITLMREYQDLAAMAEMAAVG